VPHKVFMKEKNRHLATFQNLCIIASADGALDYREKNLLYELAESMGLDVGFSLSCKLCEVQN
ncbi:MAG: hypothetical protein AAFS00_03465, partial [Bacteroidota bacterium]